MQNIAQNAPISNLRQDDMTVHREKILFNLLTHAHELSPFACCRTSPGRFIIIALLSLIDSLFYLIWSDYLFHYWFLFLPDPETVGVFAPKSLRMRFFSPILEDPYARFRPSPWSPMLVSVAIIYSYSRSYSSCMKIQKKIEQQDVGDGERNAGLEE